MHFWTRFGCIRTGGDLRFFASNGKELSYELADWNTSGVSRVWVKVPTISSSVDTIITAVWGNRTLKPPLRTMPPTIQYGLTAFTAYGTSINGKQFPL